MIVCSCNVLSDVQVRETLNINAPRTTLEVFHCLGCSPQCGRCARTIKAIMDEALGRPCDACDTTYPLPNLDPAK